MTDFKNMSKEEQVEYLRKKEEKNNQLADSIYQEELEAICNDLDELKKYLIIQGRFDRMSVNNAVMITKQHPDATIIKPSDEWKKYGASIKKVRKGYLLRSTSLPVST